MSGEPTPNPQAIPPDPSTNGGSPAPDAAVLEQIGGATLLALSPRTGEEATWSFPPDTVRPQPNFGNWPTSARYVDPDARQRIRDVIAAALIALVCATAAGLYVAGVYGAESPSKPPVSQSQDPFVIGGTGGGRP